MVLINKHNAVDPGTAHETAMGKLMEDLEQLKARAVEMEEGYNATEEGLRAENQQLKDLVSKLREDLAGVGRGKEDQAEELKDLVAKLQEDLAEAERLKDNQAGELKKAQDLLLEFEKQATEVKSAGAVTIGTFNTKEVRPETKAAAKASKAISFATTHPVPPLLAMGLTMLNIGKQGKIRAASFGSGITNNGFEVNIDCCGETEMFSSACAWLEIGPDNHDFQCGKYSTLDDHPWNKPGSSNKNQIIFQRPYPEPPRVVVWITAFDMGREKNWRLKVNATDITATGFTIDIGTWSNTILLSAAASWVAYPSDRKDIYSGHFSSKDMRPSHEPQRYNSGFIDLGEAGFTRVPRVIAAINCFDVGSSENFTLEVKVTNIMPVAMTWHMNARGKTVLYSADASYIAFC